MLTKILKYSKVDCITSKIIQPSLSELARKYGLDLIATLIDSGDSPVIKLQDSTGLIYDVSSGGEPADIIQTLKEKIKELS